MNPHSETKKKLLALIDDSIKHSEKVLKKREKITITEDYIGYFKKDRDTKQDSDFFSNPNKKPPLCEKATTSKKIEVFEKTKEILIDSTFYFDGMGRAFTKRIDEKGIIPTYYYNQSLQEVKKNIETHYKEPFTAIELEEIKKILLLFMNLQNIAENFIEDNFPDITFTTESITQYKAPEKRDDSLKVDDTKPGAAYVTYDLAEFEETENYLDMFPDSYDDEDFEEEHILITSNLPETGLSEEEINKFLYEEDSKKILDFSEKLLDYLTENEILSSFYEYECAKDDLSNILIKLIEKLSIDIQNSRQ